jgi:poly(glycerol-phosphate) alpha-glucosyltransferase
VRILLRSKIDILHLHGLWLFPSMAVRIWSLFMGRPLVISPHGMLDAWAISQSRHKKRLAGLLFEDANLRRASCLQAGCLTEVSGIRAFVPGKVALIPNGVQVVSGMPPVKKNHKCSDSRRLLYLGRIHEKKNILNLIHAWRQFKSTASGDGWTLVVAGWGRTDFVESVKAAARQPFVPGIEFVGPTFGEAKSALLASVDAFILPSLSEGLPVAILEAWTYGLPVLASEACNIPEGFDTGAAMETGTSVESIAMSLHKLSLLSAEERRCMGRRGRELVENRFSWDRVSAQWLSVYRWLYRGEGSAPAAFECQANSPTLLS